MNNLAEEIKNLIKGDVLTDPATLDFYSHDASIFEIRPDVVVFPKDKDDVKALVAFTYAQKKNGRNISLTPRSGGTCMTGGSIGSSIVLDFTKYMNKLVELKENVAVAEPGMFYRDFEKETLKKNLMMPSYPASKDYCALGGMVGNNSGGEKTLSYGKTEKYVLELKVVLEDGNEYIVRPLNLRELEAKIAQNDFEGRFYREIYSLVEKNKEVLASAKPKVSKNSSGYFLWNIYDGVTFDLTKLFVGSQGTLGIITEIKFALVEKKKYSKLLVIFVDNLNNFPKLIHAVLEKNPENFEAFDDHTLKIALKYFKEFVAQMKIGIFRLAWQFLPEFWLSLKGGIPKFVFLAEFTGDSLDDVTKRAEDAEISLHHFGLRTRIAKNSVEAKKYQTIRRESYNLLRHKIIDRLPAPFIDDIIVKPEYLPEFLPELQTILGAYQKYMIYTIQGHVGDGNFHIIPLMDLYDKKVDEIIPEVMHKVYDLVFKYKGSMSAEHNDGLIRGPYLKKMFGEQVYGLFTITKQIFDNENIFNPGKKIGASEIYGFEHLKTKHIEKFNVKSKSLSPKKNSNIFIAAILIAIIGLFFISGKYFMSKKSNISNVKFVNVSVEVDIAESFLEKSQGLSGRDGLSENSGMLFIYQEPTNPGFWMKGMNFPIDIIWIDQNFQVVDITKNMSPTSYPKSYHPQKDIAYVLEVNAGFADKYSVRIGDLVELN